jgi:hypothetical protein
MPFFKLDGDLLQAPNVEGNNLSLNEETKSDYTFPVDGWYWFATVEEAKTFFNLSD